MNALQLSVLVLCVALVGCRTMSSVSQPSQDSVMEFHSDEQQMRAEILSHLPIGTSVDEAQEFMEQHGFDCERRIDEAGAPLLSFSRYRSKGFGVDERWWGEFSYESGRTTSLWVRHGYIGL